MHTDTKMKDALTRSHNGGHNTLNWIQQWNGNGAKGFEMCVRLKGEMKMRKDTEWFKVETNQVIKLVEKVNQNQTNTVMKRNEDV